MIRTRQLNDFQVKKVINRSNEPAPADIRGYDLIPLLYSNIFMVAKKNSGKSTVIYSLLRELTNNLKRDKKAHPTKVMLFVGTIHHDPTYKQIRNLMDKRGIEYEAHDHFIQGRGKQARDLLKEILDALPDDGGDGNGPSPQFRTVERTYINSCGDKIISTKQVPVDQAEEEGDPGPTGQVAPRLICVFDDLGASMRHPSVTQATKVNRHHGMKTIFSSQYLHDLEPAAIKNIDFALLFKSLSEKKLKVTYDGLDIGIPFDQFYQLYKYSTSEPYSFFYINVRKEKFRRGFSEELTYVPEDASDDAADE